MGTKIVTPEAGTPSWLCSSLVAERQATYEQSRGLIMATGLVVLLAVATIMFVRRVDPVEVVATLLFLPLFVVFLIGGVRWGVVAGFTAALAYVLLRVPAIEAVGIERFAGLIATRTAGFVAFGAIGGWAGEQLRASITKLELYDYIDDETSLHNSRAVIEAIDLERSRADRYHEVFSVVSYRMQLVGIDRRERAALMIKLGATIESGKRIVDAAMHARDGTADVVVVVLPETGNEGARTFSAKLAGVLTATVGEHVELDATVITYPEASEELGRFVDTFGTIVARDFPEPSPTS